ncbi:hypothetical protein [Natronorubrum daqingense]|uniref:Uncharacterized protein n=1 Tax=Natronorubrum daqingense TaxID=588898 RepID=A0A1N7E190_9EURY|nr:hypothetical protein [Natronorubrum daqingense]APX96289.1 hypothetical protein BB347_06465 [Natronorubrum daqingense]SIR81715.1 hypothetical protein SAMN05421809_2379 [Natronorubrum daqingense]
MATRTPDTSTSRLGQLRNRIRSTFFESEETPADDAVDRKMPSPHSSPDPNAPGNLFQCSTCETVYIDSEKSHCSSCETTVEEVRSKLESTPPQL